MNLFTVTATDIAVSDAIVAEGGPFSPEAGSEQKIRLIKEPFTLDKGLVIGDLTFADFTGSTAKACGAGEAQAGINPLTGQRMIRLREPAGGFEWFVTGTPNLPQTIYGYAVTNNAGDALVAVALLDDPVTLTAEGQVIDIPQPIVEFPADMFV